jgi:hypothetical protein
MTYSVGRCKYRSRFGPGWVPERVADGTNQDQLKPLGEVRTRFEEPDRFLLIPAVEITDWHLVAPLHINAVNLPDVAVSVGGSNVVELLQRNIDAVLEQRARTIQPMLPHINDPNFVWGISAEEPIRVGGGKRVSAGSGADNRYSSGGPS